jgi:hypothetical protein
LHQKSQIKKDKMKKLLYSLFALTALAAILFAPQLSSAAATPTSMPPSTPISTIVVPPPPHVGTLTVSLTPLASPGFQVQVLLNGKQPLFGASVAQLNATANGRFAMATTDAYGRITFDTITPLHEVDKIVILTNYCVSIKVQYSLNGSGVLAVSKSVCHAW